MASRICLMGSTLLLKNCIITILKRLAITKQVGLELYL
jgi:hypothetical protein